MRYLLRRTGFYLVALWAAVTFNFIIPRLMPGDPAEAYIARLQTQQITRQQIEAIREEFGVNPNVPIWKQYFDYLNGILHGNLGIATSQFPTQVIDILRQSLPWTIGLVGVALILSFLIGTLIGMLIAWRRGSWPDTVVPPLLTFLSAVPYFWMALGLVYVFGVGLSWFPTDSGYDVFSVAPGWNMDFINSVIQHAILPVATLVIGTLAGWVLTMRNTMITTLSEDYVLMAQAKGLPERRVMFNYAARNAILPSITSFSISLGLVVSGSLLTEIVFNYPGIGFALFNGARVLRAQTLSLKEREFVAAARATGETSLRIIFAEILPNELALVASTFIGTFVYAVGAEVALEFLGLGDTSQATWGVILYWAQNNSALIVGKWWQFVPAGLCVAVLCAGLTFINFGIDELANPRLRRDKTPKVLKRKKDMAA